MIAIFKELLKKELKLRIKDNVYVHVEGDMLIIDIEPSDNSSKFHYHYTINRIVEKICYGILPSEKAIEITKAYKSYILRRHFHEKIF